MKKMATINNFTSLSDQELTEVEGGAVLEAAAAIYIAKLVAGGTIAIFGAGAFVGYTQGKKP